MLTPDVVIPAVPDGVVDGPDVGFVLIIRPGGPGKEN